MNMYVTVVRPFAEEGTTKRLDCIAKLFVITGHCELEKLE